MKKSMQVEQSRQKSSKKTTNLVIVFLAILLIGLSLATAFKYIHPLDLSITNFILSFQNPRLTQVAVFISWFGETPQCYLLLVLGSGAPFIARYRWEAIVLMVSNIAAIASDEFIKIIVRSPGPGAPSVVDLIKVTDYTFPSGHVIFYVTFFGLICYLTASKMEQIWKKALLITPPGILIAFVGISRVYLLEHWTSDVIGAYLLGSLFLIISIRVYKYGIVNNFKICQRK